MNFNKVYHLPKESSLKKLSERYVMVKYTQCPLECSCDLKWYPGFLKQHGSRLSGACRGNNKRRFLKLEDLKPVNFDECE
ncbi:Uncharacterised protein g11206 [Pycnogonum litorale]